MLKESEQLNEFINLDEAFIEYITNKGEIAPLTEGRIVSIPLTSP